MQNGFCLWTHPAFAQLVHKRLHFFGVKASGVLNNHNVVFGIKGIRPAVNAWVRSGVLLEELGEKC